MEGRGARQAVDGLRRRDTKPPPNTYLGYLPVVYAQPSSRTWHSGMYPSSDPRPFSCAFPPSARRLPSILQHVPVPRRRPGGKSRLQRICRRQSCGFLHKLH
eukprot:1614525-Rhodomonas_salina.2